MEGGIMEGVEVYSGGVIIQGDLLEKSSNFVKTLLNKERPKSEIQIYEGANNYSYIPISFLENTLDELTHGLWNTKNFKSDVIANELIGSLELEIYHPILNIWITRTGAGAVLIRQKKDAEITDISKKIKNTLVMDYPKLKAECFRNACLSLGKFFGRDLNRNYKDSYVEQLYKPDGIEYISEQERNELVQLYTEWKIKNIDMRNYLKNNGIDGLNSIPKSMLETIKNDIKQRVMSNE